MTGPLVVVGCGFPQLGLLKTARALGVNVVGLDLNPDAIGVALVNEFIKVSTADVEAIKTATKRVGAIGITTTGSELALTSTAQVASDLGFAFYADPSTIYRCQAKQAMREAFCKGGLSVPSFAHCNTLLEIQKFVAHWGFPVVVKPIHGWGQRGVSVVRSQDQLADRFEAAYLASFGGGGVVVERFVEGFELSVNGWVQEGRFENFAVTEREVFPFESPLGVMRSEIYPSGHSPEVEEAAVDAVKHAVVSVGLKRGPCYAQVCVTPNGQVVFEIAARCGGGFDADVTKLVSGVDLYSKLIGVALRDKHLEEVPLLSEKHPAALVRFIAPPVGTVAEIVGVQSASQMPGIVDVAVYAKPNQKLDGLRNAASRVGHLLCTGPSRSSCMERANQAEMLISIRTC